MNLWILPLAMLLGAILAFATNWLALVPWRRARHLHWTERARVYHPVRAASAGNIFYVPAVLAIVGQLLCPETCPPWFVVFMASAIGVLAGSVPADCEVFSRVSLRAFLRQVAVMNLFRFTAWIVFLVAAVAMPTEFNRTAIGLFIGVTALWVFWSYDGWVRVAGKAKLIVPAPPRLQRIVDEISARMNVPVRETGLLRISFAQAMAIPGSRKLIFTERLLELLSDEEIEAICAHELGHLTESCAVIYSRYAQCLALLPWLFFKPLVHLMGVPGFLALPINTLVVQKAYHYLSRKMEKRADSIAVSQVADSAVYARALARMYEDNLVPAVGAKERGTHPHLYDRMLAAGITPDFPRPRAATSMAWHGRGFAMLLGGLAVVLIGRMTNFFH